MKADFTGNWRANLLKSKILGPMPSDIAVKIAHSDPELHQEIVVTRPDGTEERLVFQCRTDGELGKTILDGSAVDGSACWDGGELVINLRLQAGTRRLTLCDCWSLSSDGETLSMEHRDDDLAGQITILDRAEQ